MQVTIPLTHIIRGFELRWNANKNHLLQNGEKTKMKQDRLCYIGRASVENVKEAKIFINKVLLYEKMENMNTKYLMNHLLRLHI